MLRFLCRFCRSSRRPVLQRLTDVARGVPFRMPSNTSSPFPGSAISGAPGTTVVIPCYNEADRLDLDAFVRFLTSDPPCRLLMIDDGSSDDTLAVLRDLQECAPDHVEVMALDQNSGKAEAVRRGVLAAIDAGANYVGYWDADLATPLEAIVPFAKKLNEHDELQAVFGARVRRPLSCF